MNAETHRKIELLQKRILDTDIQYDPNSEDIAEALIGTQRVVMERDIQILTLQAQIEDLQAARDAESAALRMEEEDDKNQVRHLKEGK